MRQKYQKIRNLINSYNISTDFPAFDTDKYIDFHNIYPLFMFSPSVIEYNVIVGIDSIYGDNWALKKLINC